jgi:hypothetical protein
MDNATVQLITAGATIGVVGGIARAIVGLLKALLDRRTIDFRAWGLTLAVNVVIGVFVGAILRFNLTLAAVAGYAGFDLADAMARIKLAAIKIPMTKSVKKKLLWEKAMEYR